MGAVHGTIHGTVSSTVLEGKTITFYHHFVD